MACGIRVVIWDSGSIVRAQKDHKTFFYPCNPCDEMHTLISKSGIAGSHTSHAMQVLQWKEKTDSVASKLFSWYFPLLSSQSFRFAQCVRVACSVRAGKKYHVFYGNYMPPPPKKKENK